MICEKKSPGPILQAGLILQGYRLHTREPSQLNNRGCPKSIEIKPNPEPADVRGETPLDYHARKAVLAISGTWLNPNGAV